MTRFKGEAYKRMGILLLALICFILGAIYGKINERIDCNKKIYDAQKRGYEMGRRAGGNK